MNPATKLTLFWLEDGNADRLTWSDWLTLYGIGNTPELLEQIERNLDKHGSHRQFDFSVPEEAWILRVD